MVRNQSYIVVAHVELNSTMKRYLLPFVVVLCNLSCLSTWVYYPVRDLYVTPQKVGLRYETVELRTNDGVRLHCWYIPAADERGVVLFCHGNGGNIARGMYTYSVFHAMNLSVFALEYRGYGKSGGSPSEEGTYLDARAAWNYLVHVKGVPPHRIIIFGRSLGGAVASWLAAHSEGGALVLESTFTSLNDIVKSHYACVPVAVLTRIRYDSISNIPKVRCPVLVIHSRDDEVAPFSQGCALYESAQSPKIFLEIRGSHNRGYILSGDNYSGGIDRFLSLYFDRTRR